MSLTAKELSALSVAELQKLISQAEKALANRIATEKRALQKQVAQMAAEVGVPLDELFSDGSAKKSRRGRKPAQASSEPRVPNPPMYRSKEDPSKTWTGHGKRPGWFVAFVEAGGNPKALLIRRRTPKA